MTPTRMDHDWFDADLPANVVIGEGSWLYSSFAFRHYRSRRGVSVGCRSGLYNGTFFDLGPDGEVTIGEHCSLVGAVFATNGAVVIGDRVFVAHQVVIADHAAAIPGGEEGRHLADPVVVIEDDAWIGARAVLLRGARIGRGAVVGAGTVVDGEVPAGSVVGGNPWRIVRSAPLGREP